MIFGYYDTEFYHETCPTIGAKITNTEKKFELFFIQSLPGKSVETMTVKELIAGANVFLVLHYNSRAWSDLRITTPFVNIFNLNGENYPIPQMLPISDFEKIRALAPKEGAIESGVFASGFGRAGATGGGSAAATRSSNNEPYEPFMEPTPGGVPNRIMNPYEVILSGKKYLYNSLNKVYEIKNVEEEPENWNFETYKGVLAPPAIQERFRQYKIASAPTRRSRKNRKLSKKTRKTRR